MGKGTLALLIIIGIAGLSFSMFMAGYEYYLVSNPHEEPKVVVVERWHEPEVVELVKEIETIREVEVDRYLYKFEDWNSIEELQSFLESDNTEMFNGYRSKIDDWDCDNLAINLMDSAQKKGKRLSFVYLSPADARRWFNYDGEAHAVCGAIVGNTLYYIDPNNDRVSKVCNLD